MQLQRGKFLIKNICELDNCKEDNDGLKNVINLSYMGQFEYEGNTIPISRMKMEYYKDDYIFYPIDITNTNGEQMFIYVDSVSLNSQEDGYIYSYIRQRINSNLSLWEAINSTSSYDLWWDIDSNMLIFFGEEKKDIINYFINSCFERDNKGDGLVKKLVKAGYRV